MMGQQSSMFAVGVSLPLLLILMYAIPVELQQAWQVLSAICSGPLQSSMN